MPARYLLKYIDYKEETAQINIVRDITKEKMVKKVLTVLRGQQVIKITAMLIAWVNL